MSRILLALATLSFAALVSGCGLVAGAGGAVVADEVAEEREGGDGLF